MTLRALSGEPLGRSGAHALDAAGDVAGSSETATQEQHHAVDVRVAAGLRPARVMTRAAIVLLVFGLAGCGGARAGHKSAPTTPRGATATATAYLDRVSGIDHGVGDERSRFFHGKPGTANVLAEARRVRSALTTGVAQLAQLHPPAKLAALHAKLLGHYRRSVGASGSRARAPAPAVRTAPS